MDFSRFSDRVRAAVSFLSDLGGALAFISLAVGLVAAAVGGATLAALNILDQPYFALLVTGIAFGATGLALHALRSRFGQPRPAPARASSSPRPSPDERAMALQRAYEGQFGDSSTQRLRQTSRRVREELLDNRHELEKLLTGDPFYPKRLTFERWQEGEQVLLDYVDPEPHRAASSGYREIKAIWGRFDRPSGADIGSAMRAIDRAVEVLGRVRSGSSGSESISYAAKPDSRSAHKR